MIIGISVIIPLIPHIIIETIETVILSGPFTPDFVSVLVQRRRSVFIQLQTLGDQANLCIPCGIFSISNQCGDQWVLILTLIFRNAPHILCPAALIRICQTDPIICRILQVIRILAGHHIPPVLVICCIITRQHRIVVIQVQRLTHTRIDSLTILCGQRVRLHHPVFPGHSHIDICGGTIPGASVLLLQNGVHINCGTPVILLGDKDHSPSVLRDLGFHRIGIIPGAAVVILRKLQMIIFKPFRGLFAILIPPPAAQAGGKFLPVIYKHLTRILRIVNVQLVYVAVYIHLKIALIPLLIQMICGISDFLTVLPHCGNLKTGHSVIHRIQIPAILLVSCHLYDSPVCLHPGILFVGILIGRHNLHIGDSGITVFPLRILRVFQIVRHLTFQPDLIADQDIIFSRLACGPVIAIVGLLCIYPSLTGRELLTLIGEGGPHPNIRVSPVLCCQGNGAVLIILPGHRHIGNIQQIFIFIPLVYFPIYGIALRQLTDRTVLCQYPGQGQRRTCKYPAGLPMTIAVFQVRPVFHVSKAIIIAGDFIPDLIAFLVNLRITFLIPPELLTDQTEVGTPVSGPLQGGNILAVIVGLILRNCPSVFIPVNQADPVILTGEKLSLSCFILCAVALDLRIKFIQIQRLPQNRVDTITVLRGQLDGKHHTIAALHLNIRIGGSSILLLSAVGHQGGVQINASSPLILIGPDDHRLRILLRYLHFYQICIIERTVFIPCKGQTVVLRIVIIILIPIVGFIMKTGGERHLRICQHPVRVFGIEHFQCIDVAIYIYLEVSPVHFRVGLLSLLGVNGEIHFGHTKVCGVQIPAIFLISPCFHHSAVLGLNPISFLIHLIIGAFYGYICNKSFVIATIRVSLIFHVNPSGTSQSESPVQKHLIFSRIFGRPAIANRRLPCVKASVIPGKHVPRLIRDYRDKVQAIVIIC